MRRCHLVSPVYSHSPCSNWSWQTTHPRLPTSSPFSVSIIMLLENVVNVYCKCNWTTGCNQCCSRLRLATLTTSLLILHCLAALYVAFVMGTSTVSTAVSIIVLYYHHHLPNHRVPRIVRIIFFQVMYPCLLISH